MPTVRPLRNGRDITPHRFPKQNRKPLPMAVPPHHFDDEPSGSPPGGLLGELERRQDDVLSQLDDLDAKLAEVLKGLEPTSTGLGDGCGQAESFQLDWNDDDDDDLDRQETQSQAKGLFGQRDDGKVDANDGESGFESAEDWA